MKKICIVSLNGVNNAGGVEKVSFYLNEILKKNHDVQIIEKSKINFGKLNNLIQPIMVSLKLLFIKGKIVIGNSWHCFLYPADISVHHGTSAGIMKNMGINSFSLRMIAFMEKVSAKKSKKIVAVSENCKNELITLYKIPPEKIIVINNFVDDEVFQPAVNEKHEEINICFSGALLEKKGLQKLIELSDFLEQYESTIPVKLNIATNYEKNSEYFINKKNTTISIGLKFNQMADFYKNNDVMFFPTLYEGFSMAVLEALSSGVCVVGSNFAVTPEIEDFEFCKRINNDLPCEEIVKIIEDLFSEFKGKKNEIHEIVECKFGKKQYIDKINDLLNNPIYF